MSAASILICSYGDTKWADLAKERALPSAGGQGATDIVVLHDAGGTLAGVRNEAALHAKTEWLCFLDADDELAPGYLMAMYRAIATRMLLGTARDTLYAPAMSFVIAGVQTAPFTPNAGGWPRLNECVIGTVVHKDLFHEVGGFRELDGYEDWDLWLRCETAGAVICHVPGAVYKAHSAPAGRNSKAGLDEVYARIWADYEAASA